MLMTISRVPQEDILQWRKSAVRGGRTQAAGHLVVPIIKTTPTQSSNDRAGKHAWTRSSTRQPNTRCLAPHDACDDISLSSAPSESQRHSRPEVCRGYPRGKADLELFFEFFGELQRFLVTCLLRGSSTGSFPLFSPLLSFVSFFGALFLMLCTLIAEHTLGRELTVVAHDRQRYACHGLAIFGNTWQFYSYCK